MSETEYGRLAAQLTDISEQIASTRSDVRVINEKLTGYAEFQAQVTRHDKTLAMIEQRCQAVQDAKKNTSMPWGSVKGAILGGIVVGIIMMVINLVIRYAN